MLIIKYERNGKQYEQKVGNEGKEWWLKFEEKWEEMQIIEFVEVEYTNEQLARKEETKDFTQNEDVENYIENGIIPSTEQFANLKLKKENKELKDALAELTILISMGGVR